MTKARTQLIALAVAITQWANDRRIIREENLKGQFMKLVSEWGEVCSGFLRRDSAELKDGIGDTFVMLNNVAAIMGGDICGLMNNGNSVRSDSLIHFAARIGMLSDFVVKNQRDEALAMLGELANDLAFIAQGHGMPLVECVQAAYDEIKHRRGVMYNGTFIKESDPRYQGVMYELRHEELTGCSPVCAAIAATQVSDSRSDDNAE